MAKHWSILISNLGLALAVSVLSVSAATARGLPCQPTSEHGSGKPEFICRYSSEDAYRRIGKLLDPETQSLKVEDVSILFGAPLLRTSDEGTRFQHYLTVLGGADGWRLVLSIFEGYYPTNQGQAKFVPGRHPKRLDGFENSARRVQIFFEEASPLKRDAAHCPRPPPFVSIAAAKGWAESKELIIPTDGGRAPPSLDGPRGRHLVVDIGFGFGCAQQIDFSESAQRAIAGR